MEPTNSEEVLGVCSFCQSPVEHRHVIIDYEHEDGKSGYWAECPSCNEIVDPTSDAE